MQFVLNASVISEGIRTLPVGIEIDAVVGSKEAKVAIRTRPKRSHAHARQRICAVKSTRYEAARIRSQDAGNGDGRAWSARACRAGRDVPGHGLGLRRHDVE